MMIPSISGEFVVHRLVAHHTANIHTTQRRITGSLVLGALAVVDLCCSVEFLCDPFASWSVRKFLVCSVFVCRSSFVNYKHG